MFILGFRTIRIEPLFFLTKPLFLVNLGSIWHTVTYIRPPACTSVSSLLFYVAFYKALSWCPTGKRVKGGDTSLKRDDIWHLKDTLFWHTNPKPQKWSSGLTFWTLWENAHKTEVFDDKSMLFYEGFLIFSSCCHFPWVYTLEKLTFLIWAVLWGKTVTLRPIFTWPFLGRNRSFECFECR